MSLSEISGVLITSTRFSAAWLKVSFCLVALDAADAPNASPIAPITLGKCFPLATLPTPAVYAESRSGSTKASAKPATTSVAVLPAAAVSGLIMPSFSWPHRAVLVGIMSIPRLRSLARLMWSSPRNCLLRASSVPYPFCTGFIQLSGKTASLSARVGKAGFKKSKGLSAPPAFPATAIWLNKDIRPDQSSHPKAWFSLYTGMTYPPVFLPSLSTSSATIVWFAPAAIKARGVTSFSNQFLSSPPNLTGPIPP